MECTDTYLISPRVIALIKLRPKMPEIVPGNLMINIIRRPVFVALFLAVGAAEMSFAQETKTAASWPYPIPCRIHDGASDGF